MSKANGAAGAAKSASTGTAQAGIATEMSAQAAGAQVAKASASTAAAAATAEGGAGVAGAGVPIAGIVAGIAAFVPGVLLVGQIVSVLFGFWENEADKQAMEGLTPYITYEMVEAALDAQEKYGHPAGCTLAQIICESG